MQILFFRSSHKANVVLMRLFSSVYCLFEVINFFIGTSCKLFILEVSVAKKWQR